MPPIIKKRSTVKGSVILFIFIIACFQQVFGITEITGIVKDKSTNEALAYATISFTEGQYGVITDDEGSFRLEVKKPNNKDTVIISYVGYEAIKITTKALKQDGNVFLKPYIFEIDEVVVTPLHVEDILRKAYDDFFKNHVHRDIATRGYYREQYFDNNECVRFGEAVFDSKFYQEDGKDLAAIEPYLARSIEDSTFLHKLNHIFNTRRELIKFGIDTYFENGIIEGFSVDTYHKFLGELFFEQGKDGLTVDYKLKQSYVLKDRENYFVNFNIYKKGKHIADGHFLIDKDTYGLAAFEIQFREQEDLTRILIPPRFRMIMKLLGYNVEIVDLEAKLYNRYENNKWFIGSGIQILQMNIAKRGNWVNGKIVNEFHSFYSREYKHTKIEKKDFNDQRVVNFNSHFWGDYPFSPIQPNQQAYISKIIEKNDEFSGSIYTKKVIKRKAKQAKKKAKESDK